VSSSIVTSKCSDLGICVAVGAAIIVTPFEGWGGGPLLDDAVCSGACDAGPCPPLPSSRSRGIPPEGGGPGGWSEKLWDSCRPGLNALSSAMLPPGSPPVADLIAACWACSFAMFSSSFLKI
jgi:hypothetical protein